MDNKTQAIIFGNDCYNGYIIWYNPNGGGCIAMNTDPSNKDLLQNTLNIVVQNEWKMTSFRMHACPLANEGHFGESRDSEIYRWKKF
jgi:hypothetical protein